MFSETDIQKFRAQLRGELIRRDEPRYDETRKFFNRMIDKRPALLVLCAGVAGFGSPHAAGFICPGIPSWIRPSSVLLTILLSFTPR